ncbi:MAG: GGDEF domain-containing protein [Deltaproteobacteria bacterium]|nr:GGDEF domain-containing protein [Deltaproteobacteria bacterium]
MTAERTVERALKRRDRHYLWDALLVGASLGFILFFNLEVGGRLGLSFGVLMLAPVLFATHRLGVEIGCSTATLASLMLLLEELWQHPDGARLPILWNAAVVGIFLFAVALVLGRLQRSEGRLQAIASTDPLTGIANRRALMHASEVELRRQSRSMQPLSVVHLDLDNFKRLNDTHGHAEGDRLLVAVADVLGSGRLTDVAARVGGDEFVLLLPDTSPAAARVMVDRLRDKLTQVLGAHPRWLGVTCSVGIATFMQAATDAAQLIAAADQMMYEIKRGAKNGVRQVVIDGDHTTELLRGPATIRKHG